MNVTKSCVNQGNKRHVDVQRQKERFVDKRRRQSVAEERGRSRAASSPAAIMRTGSRVYRSRVT